LCNAAVAAGVCREAIPPTFQEFSNMKTSHALISAMLLGGLAASIPAHADEVPAPPAAEIAVDDAALPADSISEADGAGQPSAVAAPAWEHLVPVGAALQPGSNGQPIGDKTLRLVQRSTTGKLVGAQVALALFSGSIGGSSFSKDQLKGTRVDSVPNPAFDYLTTKMRESLAAYFTAHPGALPTEETDVQATVSDFTLIYKELDDAQTAYELRQTMHVGFPYRRKLLRLTGGEGVQCTVERPVSATLEAWQADDYALARQTAREYTDACAAKFAAVLPTLFPDRQAVAAD